MHTLMKYTLSWIGLVVIAILNGSLRNYGYGPSMHELGAHQLSTVMGLILFSVYIWILTGVWPIASARQAIQIGILWLGLTIIFEFLFGHYVMGNTWALLFNDYNLLAGRLWVLILIWTTIAPLIFYRIRTK